MELVDAYNENNEFTGIIVDRWKALEQGYWKRGVSCWIMNKKGEVLLQKRTRNKRRNPNKWAKTGGQVDAGETVEEAIFREVKEELGVEIPKEGISLKNARKSKNENRKMFMYSFIFIVDYKIEDYTIQEEEVSEIKYVTIEDIIRAREYSDKNYTFLNWKDEDFYEEIKLLLIARKKAFGGITTMEEMKRLIDKNREIYKL